MAELPISQELADKLIRLAQQRNRSLEDMLSNVVEGEQPSTANKAKKYERIEDDPTYQAARKRIMPKIYSRARAYWQSVGDQERLALTDKQLDEQFWRIDPEGIPRLKADQATVILPPDPVVEEARKRWQEWQENGWGDQIGTEDIDTRTFLNTEFPKHLLRRMGEDDGDE